MKKYIIVLLVFFLFSCEGNLVFYEYNGVTITRIDRGNKLYFYYGKKGTPSFDKKTYFKLTYKGLNSAAGAGLKFLDNGIVQVNHMYGYFSIKGDTNKMYVPPSNTLLNPDWRDSLFVPSYNFNNIIVVFDYIKAEQEKNKKHHSKVATVYQKERSFWNIFY